MRILLCLALACVFAAAISGAHGYALTGKSWPSGTVTLQLGLGNSPFPLSDGNTSWDSAVAPALAEWNQKMGRMQLNGVVNPSAPVSSGDRVNSVVFSNSVFGQSFGYGTLAVTYYITQGSTLVEADILFNRAQTFDSYRGALRFGGAGGFALADIRRVFLHEVGHGIGLNHSGSDTIMAATISDREVLSGDDIAGIQAIYGAPPPPPPPAPTPPPAPQQPGGQPGASRLANISTRMKVGVDDNVLIGGFVVSGAQSKRIVLRAVGPSLNGVVPGALGDTTIDVYDSGGRVIAQNDNWQQSAQAGEISSSGLAPSHPLEAAIAANLSPGAYTAIVRGANRTQGVALVEGYELDSTGSRLTNLSTRGRIGVGDEVMIGGVIVQGAESKRVIIRAVGPSIAASVPGALSNPSLELYNSSGNQIAANDNWADSAQLSEITASALAPSHGNESAIVAALAPGGYTAIVRGVNNSVGVGLIEVFDLQP